MQEKTKFTLIAAAVALVFVLFNSLYILPQTEQAIVLQFGEPVRLVKEPGLKFRLQVFIEDCTGCGVCYDTRTCPQRDDAAQIVGKMIAADVIVLATPVYFYTMSAQMKTLIDRCCARYTEMTGKEFYFIVAAADDSKAAMERTIDGFRGFLDCLDDSRECGTIYGVGAWKIGEIEGSPAMKQAYDAGLNC